MPSASSPPKGLGGGPAGTARGTTVNHPPLCVILRMESIAMATRAQPDAEHDQCRVGNAMAKNDRSPAQSEHRLDALVRALRAYLPALRERCRVRALGVFGSYVRGEQQPGSDLDLLVDFDDLPSLLQFIQLEQELSDALGVKVDLVIRDDLKPGIARHVLREVVPL